MSDIIMGLKEDDNNMGYLDIGRAVGSLGRIDVMDVLPPLIGGTVAIGTTLLVRKFGKNKPNLHKFAPLIGAGASALGSIPLYWWRGPRAVISGAMTGVVVGGGLFAFEWLSKTQWALTGIGKTVVQRLPGRVQGMVHAYSPNRPGARIQVVPTAQSPGGFDMTGFGASV